MEMTHQEIADEMGLSAGRIWQIEKAALAKLRKRLLVAGITKEDIELLGKQNLTNQLSRLGVSDA